MSTKTGLHSITVIFGIPILIALALAACGERRFANPQEEEQVVPFPNKVGTFWVYEVADSVRQTTDTITITITDTITLPGLDGVASIWTCEPRVYYVGAPNPIQYILADPEMGTGTDKDTAQFYFWTEGHSPWMTSIFPFPLEPGDNWTSDLRYMYDSTHVEEITNVSVPAGDFSDAFRLTQVYSCGDECAATYTYWWKEGKGMVKSHLQEWDHYDHPSEPSVIATWVLIDYSIAK